VEAILKIPKEKWLDVNPPRLIAHDSSEKIWKINIQPVHKNLKLSELRTKMGEAKFSANPLAITVMTPRNAKKEGKQKDTAKDSDAEIYTACIYLEKEQDFDELLQRKSLRLSPRVLAKFIPTQNMTHDADILVTLLSPIPRSTNPLIQVRQFCNQHWRQEPYKMVQSRNPLTGDLKSSCMLVWKKSKLGKVKEVTKTIPYQWATCV
jgi:hypothetical protein